MYSINVVGIETAEAAAPWRGEGELPAPMGSLRMPAPVPIKPAARIADEGQWRLQAQQDMFIPARTGERGDGASRIEQSQSQAIVQLELPVAVAERGGPGPATDRPGHASPGKGWQHA